MRKPVRIPVHAGQRFRRAQVRPRRLLRCTLMLTPVSDLTPVSWDSLWTIEGLVALGTLFVALGTLGLASVTAFLARRTSTMASQTAELADLTEKDVALARTAIEADVRPVLISVPPEQFVREQNFVVRVPETSL